MPSVSSATRGIGRLASAGWKTALVERRYVGGGRLQMLAPLGPILPLDDNTLIILSGAFAGETITRDPVSGLLFHQRHVYKPI